MTEQPSAKNEMHYNDFWIKIIGCGIASELIDSLGREESIFKRLTSLFFYLDFLGGFIIALILWEIVRFVVGRLDRKYDWFQYPLQRIFLQLFLGIITPAFLCFLFTFLFMKIAYNQDIFKTEWLYNEFYAVILIIIIINLIYFTWWLFMQWQEAERKPPIEKFSPEINKILPANNEIMISEPGAIEVTKAGKNILLPQTEISFVILEGGYTFIKTFIEESFVTTYTLDELTKLLDRILFFRANRQVIISRKSCKAYANIENGKISVELLIQHKEPIVVSQKRAKDFRKWISGTLSN